MTIIEIGVSKFARFSMSSIDMGILDLTAFISYRYVGFSLFTIIMTVLELIGLGFIPYVFLVYFILAESYFYVINLIIIVFGGLGIFFVIPSIITGKFFLIFSPIFMIVLGAMMIAA